MMKLYTTVMLFCVLVLYGQKPIAKFTTNVLGNSITFNDQSSANPQSYLWEFSGGNPSTSTIANPIVTFSGTPPHMVKLTVTNMNGTSTLIKQISNSSGNIIDLSTGRNEDGSLMTPDAIKDNDWTVTNSAGVVTVPITRTTYPGWSYAALGNNGQQSVWITHGSETGYFDYKSKIFTIPAGVNDAKLNLKSLSFVRNWTYLVKVNDDNTTTENQITATSWMNDGAKGWLNSRSPEVSNYSIVPGKYYIKVRLYTNNSTVRGSIDVNANVQYESGVRTPNNISISSSMSSFCKGAAIPFSASIENESMPPISYNWVFKKSNDSILANGQSPNVIFPNIGLYSAKLKVSFSDGSFSTLFVPDYITVNECQDYTLAPNSYIFYKGGILPSGQKTDGLYIPIKKVYQIWRSGRFMQTKNGNYTPIDSNAIPSVVVYWEDVDGLIDSVSLDNFEREGEDSKIKVLVNKTKGEGNASIAFKVNNIIYWTWHIWVTDDPSKGASYGQGFETNMNGEAFVPIYMDRNLGATNAHFLGNDWHKSGGLMYQWGRKDPIPPLEYKDGTFYEVTGAAGNLRHSYAVLEASKIPVRLRGLDTGSNDVGENIRYSINNPVSIITHNINDGVWFSNSEYKVNNVNTDLIEAWDLWSDNRKGLNSNASSGNSVLANDSKSYKLKSEFDPCPNGWRVPSQYGRNTTNNNLNPFGRRDSGANDDTNSNYSMIRPDSNNPVLNGVKVYPGRGIDFSDTDNRKIGIIPTSGNYVYYSKSGNVVYQDQASDAILLNATYGIGGTRGTIIHSDAERTDVSTTGWNGIYVNQTNKTNGLGGVRCMKDPNLELLPDFYKTEYILSKNSDETNYESWVKEPNSFVVMTGDNNEPSTDKELHISLKKAYAMQKLYLSENKQLPIGNINTGSVIWSDNPNLIKKIQVIGSYPDEEIKVTLAAKQKGNAVVGFHKGDNGVWNTTSPDKILWSWHIWAPVTNPLLEENQITYTTESIANGGVIPTTNASIINSTKSLSAPLVTTFMDRNLGALQVMPSSLVRNNLSVELQSKTQIQQSGGLHYQWGRKDPLPTFHYPGGNQYISNHNNSVRVASTYNVYKQIGTDSNGNVIFNISAPITDAIFSSTDNNGYSREWNNYKLNSGINATDSKSEKIRKVIKYATENPLFFLFRNKTGNELGIEDAGTLAAKSQQVKDWISDENGLVQDRWGHSSGKSPYDPCPEGWRVPDTGSATLFAGGNNGSYAKGSSPWFYNGYNTTSGFSNYGILQGVVSDLVGSATNNPQNVKQYPGYTLTITTEGSAPSSRTGWVFNFPNSKYNIGNIPTTGIRGILGGNDWKNIKSGYPSADNFRYQTGLWTSSPADFYTGYAIGLNLSSVSGYGGKLASGTGFYPQAAMGVRCAKDIERYMGDLPYSSLTTNKNSKIIIPSNSTISDSELEVFPNPVKDILLISFKNNVKESEFVMYDILGHVVKRGEILNNKIDVSDLSNGIYLLNIKNVSRSFKIIKQ